MILEFFVPFPVYPKNKKRAFRTGFITEDARTKDNAHSLVSLFWPHRPEKPIEGLVTVSYRFQTAWRTPDAKRRAKGLLPEFVPQATGSDLGNRTKQADDVLKKAGFLKDDKQIWNYGGTCKVWADVTGVFVRIESLDCGDKISEPERGRNPAPALNTEPC